MKGLKIFLDCNYPKLFFQRQTPIRQKPGPKIKKSIQYSSLGLTGYSLTHQISSLLSCAYPNINCDILLIIDDLDCHDPQERRNLFFDTIKNALRNISKDVIIGFAKPEIESWLIADWCNTFGANSELRPYHVKIRRGLIQAYKTYSNKGSIEKPESFGILDKCKDSCQKKLSNIIQEVVFIESGVHYSKKDHSGRMLQKANALNITKSCPEFQLLHNELFKKCG